LSHCVVVLTSSFPRDDGDPSGHFVRSHARALARELSPSSLHGDVRVHVIAPLDGPERAEPPLIVHPVGGAALFRAPGALARAAENPLRLAAAPSFAAGAIRKLRELAPIHLLICHWIVPCAWPVAASVKAPLHVVSHGADVRLLASAPAPLREAVVRSLLDRGARFQFVAAHLLERLASALRNDLAARLRASSRVEPAPIELPDVTAAAAELRASLSLDEGERLAVCAGRLVAEKRYNLALAAASLAPRVRVALVGDGPERRRLGALAAASGLGVTSTGALPRRAALTWIAAADVLVHPSAHEGAPTVVREARALGTRVVACAAGDVAAWARSDPGIAIVAPDARAIAEAMMRPAPC